jgi:uncharacterized protein YggE
MSSLERSAVINLHSTDQASINQVLDTARSARAEADVIGFGLTDSSQAATEARSKAVANARENAAEMAAAEGMRLGEVLDISDYGYPQAMYENSAGLAQSSMVDVTSYVLVTYELRA